MGGVRRVSIHATASPAPLEQPDESPRLDLPPLNIVPMTPPIEATLRILLNSVPYLIGAAVVRQPAVGDSIEASVGRMPWLHDRRLLNLQLPDDTLPANRAILLDWPVPYQAEWVGIPPRLLISRLVARERTVGVLLGTLITREQITAQAREALDLSCELIAAAVGSDSLATFAATAQPERPRRLVVVPNEPEPEPEPEPDFGGRGAEPPDAILDPKDEQEERDRQVVEEVARALDELTDARSIGRVLRDAVTAIAGVDGFSISLFNSVRREVAYRYKVVGAEPESAEMGRQAVDDGPDCYAARRDRRWHSYPREIGVRGPEGLEARKISVLQYPLVAADEVFGIATLQVFGEAGFSDHATRLVLRVIDVSSDRLAAVRRAARFQPSPSPLESAAAAVLPPAAAAPSSTPEQPEAPTTDQILNDLLAKCAEIGLPTSFMVGVDPAAGLLRGELVSGSAAARELDYALGISVGRFTIELADRYNVIARACREGRIVTSPTLDELVSPLRDADGAATLERLVQGGRSTIIPISVSGDVVGALVVGPMADEPGFSTIVKVRDMVNETASRLTEAWRTNS
jgi:hypothetical protein